ncbi:lytic transglycosylase domain-containing protein [Scandinavium goeteborgense]|uniref:Soluble lytic murein transglycosylase-like protein n=1 Tax=Scandinavium goeteborgense TaxID=1851514 RepID=A0A4R6DSG3_SCAGO|nr:lytic transglycosylase domain-containing protein [Scandinavium goeteborgense]TDN48065.1 soluble lytic murein transglycosylase-like protein [Scandinavium goeteborgense]
MKPLMLAVLMLTGSQVMAASDAEILYASLYTNTSTPAVQEAYSDEPHASQEWTQAMQAQWGETRALSQMAVLKKQVINEIQDVVSHPVVKGIRRNIPAEISAIITKYARQFDVSEQLVTALIQTESSFNPRAVSGAGAKGLMQLMPVHTVKQGIDPFDPDQNVRAGMKFLSRLLSKYGDLRLALAAYNAGEKAVDKYGGIPPYPETQKYVKDIMALLGVTSGEQNR